MAIGSDMNHVETELNNVSLYVIYAMLVSFSCFLFTSMISSYEGLIGLHNNIPPSLKMLFFFSFSHMKVSTQFF